MACANAPNDVDYTAGYSTATNSFFFNCCAQVLPANQGNITNAPAFVNFSGGNFRLLSSSRCINTGTNEAWMGTAVDMDGLLRIDRFGGKVDVGCYEFMHQGTLFTGH